MPPDPMTVARLAAATDEQLTDEAVAITRAATSRAIHGESQAACWAHLDLIHAEKNRRKNATACRNCGMSDATCRSIHAKTADYCCDLCETAFVHFENETTHGQPEGDAR